MQAEVAVDQDPIARRRPVYRVLDEVAADDIDPRRTSIEAVERVITGMAPAEPGRREAAGAAV